MAIDRAERRYALTLAMLLGACSLEHPRLAGGDDVPTLPKDAAVDLPPPDVATLDAPDVPPPPPDVPAPIDSPPPEDLAPVDVPAPEDLFTPPDVPPPPPDVPPPPPDVPPPTDTGPTCPSGQSLCAGGCRAIATDTAHCGGCDRPCASGQVCAGGSCLTCGAPGQDCCPGASCGPGVTCSLALGRCIACGEGGQRCCGGVNCNAGLACLPVDLIGYCVDATRGGGMPGRGCRGDSTNPCDTGLTCRTIPVVGTAFCVRCGVRDYPCCAGACSTGTCVVGYCV